MNDLEQYLAALQGRQPTGGVGLSPIQPTAPRFQLNQTAPQAPMSVPAMMTAPPSPGGGGAPTFDQLQGGANKLMELFGGGGSKQAPPAGGLPVPPAVQGRPIGGAGGGGGAGDGNFLMQLMKLFG